MHPGRIAAGRARAVRVIIALTAVSTCLGAVAYAATHPEGPTLGLGESKTVTVAPPPGGGPPPGKEDARLLLPRFIESPTAVSTVAAAQFRFHVPPRSQRPSRPLPGLPSGTAAPTRRFQCRLDDGEWEDCSSPHRLAGLGVGAHAFTVRALNRVGRPGPPVSYSWRQAAPSSPPAAPSPPQQQVDPKPFSIELREELEDFHPGYPSQQLQVVVTNPNPGAIEVTSLTVAIAGAPPGCSAENFALTPSSASATAPLIVPAGASVSLPTTTTSAPAISMLNLPVDQDACQGVEVPLVFSGEAHG